MIKIKYSSFKMGDLFEKLPVKKAQPNKLSKVPNNEYTVPVVYAKFGDNGIMYWGKKGDFTTYSNVISIVYNGAISAGKVYAQERETGILAESYFIRIKNNPDIPFEANLYIAIVIEKSIYPKYSRDNLATWTNKIEREIIKLPVIESHNPNHQYTIDDINWQYMHDRITELEHDRITELDTYLKATGLNDYELTEEDKKLLSLSAKSAPDKTNALEVDSENGELIIKKYQISNIFEKVYAKCKKNSFNKANDTSTECNKEFCIPLINAKLGDNGIMYYGRKEDWNTQSMCIDVIQNGAIATGTVYAQPQTVAVLWDAYLIKPITKIRSKEVLLYLSKCIEKVIKKQFSYYRKATWDKVKKCEIYLPTTPDNKINFDYMERYIRAVEKLVIADVVKYKDKVIETTKKIVTSKQ